jgi:phage shock protein A
MDKTLNAFESGMKAQGSFDRMEDKVAAMEARTEALEELNSGASKLEQEFLDMKNHTEIDDELAALKRKVGTTTVKTESEFSTSSSRTNLL